MIDYLLDRENPAEPITKRQIADDLDLDNRPIEDALAWIKGALEVINKAIAKDYKNYEFRLVVEAGGRAITTQA